MRHLLEELDGKQTIVFALRPTGPAQDTSETAEDGASQKKSEPSRSPEGLFPERQLLFPEPQKESDTTLPPPPPPLPELPPYITQKESSQSSLWELSGAIALADDFKLRCTVRTASSGEAKAVMKGFDELRLRMGGLATLLAGSDKECAFLKEIPNSFLAVRKGRIILVEGHLSADTMAKLLGTKVIVKTH